MFGQSDPESSVRSSEPSSKYIKELHCNLLKLEFIFLLWNKIRYLIQVVVFKIQTGAPLPFQYSSVRSRSTLEEVHLVTLFSAITIDQT